MGQISAEKSDLNGSDLSGNQQTETYHRFVDKAAFLAACDAAGWTRGPGNRPMPPEGVILDVIGPAVTPPEFAGTLIVPGTIDARCYVNIAWFSGTAVPASFAAAKVIPERPIRMFAARDPGQKAAALKLVFEVRKLAKPDDPKLLPTATVILIEKID